MSKKRNEEYLGDGIYASFDGFAIMLRAPREYGDHFIVLEPREVRALMDYAKRKLSGEATS
jgi:hypothetical protein